MALTPEQKKHAIKLIKMGEKPEAVRYFQQVLAIDAEQALLLTEKMEKEVEPKFNLQEFHQKYEEMKRTAPNITRPAGLIFMCLGIVLLAYVFYLRYAYQQFEETAVTVKGTVVDFQSEITEHDRGRMGTYTTITYTPVFEYVYEGKKYTYVSTSSSKEKEYEVGERFDILVNPENPANVLVHSFMEKWSTPAWLGFLGTLFTGLGYVLFAVLKKRS